MHYPVTFTRELGLFELQVGAASCLLGLTSASLLTELSLALVNSVHTSDYLTNTLPHEPVRDITAVSYSVNIHDQKSAV